MLLVKLAKTVQTLNFMSKRIAILFLALMFWGFNVNAQQGIDSLKVLLKRQNNDAARMHISLEIGDKYNQFNIDSALIWYNSIIPKEYANQAQFSEWFKNAQEAPKYYVTVALARSGLIFAQSNSIDKSVSNLDAAFTMALQIGQPQLAVYCSDNLAVILARNRNLELASVYFEKSLGVYRSLNDTQGISYCLGNLGVINANLGNLYKAVGYYEELLSLQDQTRVTKELIDDILNIAAIYTKLEEFDKAKPYWEKVLPLVQSANDNEKVKIVLTNLGSVAFKLGDYNASLSSYSKLLDVSVSQNDKYSELIALNNIAIIHYNLNEINQSIFFWERTLVLAKSLANTQITLDALMNLSGIYYQIDNLEKASEFFEQFIALGRQIGDAEKLLQSYLGAAEIQERLGNFDKSREYYAEALSISSKNNDTQSTAKINVLIAKTFKEQHRYLAALDFYTANLEVESQLSAKNLALTYHGKADVFRLQMQYTRSLDLYQKALSIWQQEQDNNQISACLNAMGFVYEVTGIIPNAILSYESALELALGIGNREAIAAISNNLGVVYRKLGDLPKARDSYQRALDIYIELNNTEGMSYCYNNLGIIYEQSAEFDKANEYYEKSLELKQNSKDLQGLATSLMNLGNVYKFLGNHVKAEEYYSKALDISINIHDFQGEAFAIGSIAALKLELNDYNTAISYALRSLSIANTLDLKNAIKESYRQLGWAYSATLVPEKAEEAYLKVIEMNHNEIGRNFSILSESEKELFFKTVSSDFNRFNAFALRRKITNPAITETVYNNLLRNKGLLLKSSTAMRNAILNSNNKQLIENFEQWIRLRQEIARQYTIPAEQRTSNPEDLENQANNLERLLVRSSSEFSNFDKSLSIDWKMVRESLVDNEAAIEFTHFATAVDSVIYCALIVTKDSESPIMIDLFGEKELTAILEVFSGNNQIYINNIYGKNSEPNTSLYNLIWKPLEDQLKDIKTVYLSPSGLLHKVSFGAVASENNSYLIDKYNLRLVSSTASITSKQELNLNENFNVSMFGGIKYTTHPDTRDTWKYLEGTQSEVMMIKGILNRKLANVTVVTDTQATEEKFKSIAPQSNLLHVATHGFFFPDPKQILLSMEAATEYGEVEFRGGSPTFGMDNFVRNQNPLMRSGLVFAGVNDYWSGAKPIETDDAVLTALEVINIDLRKNQLVVMSACETGLGDIAGSEGVYGLQRAFKMAGTQSLIMSLWQVPDKETAEFMQIFYGSLLDLGNLNKAFTYTQEVMRKKYDPYFWAAFVLLD
jgi:tetratricopeptide (TPR) repeat protein